MLTTKLPAEERPIVLRMFLYSLTVATSYIIARTVGDSLFLSRVGNDHLALVFVMAGCTTAVVASCWYWLTHKISIGRTMQISGLGFSAVTLAAWLALPSFHHSFWLLAAIYLLAEIRGCVNAINVVSALNTKLGREASKTAWTVVGLAAPLAAMIVGEILAYEVALFSLRSWLLIGCVMDFASFGVGLTIEHSKSLKKLNREAVNPRRRVKPESKKVYVRSDHFKFWIGILIAAKVVVLTFVSFEWKTSVNTFYAGHPERLVQFFGVYYGLVGLATIALQYFVTGRLLKRRNLKIPILLMPVVLLFLGLSLTIGVGVFAGLVVATMGKSLEVWRRSVHDTTLNTLYTKIRRQQRRSIIALNSALVKPLSEVSAAGIIFFSAATFYRPVMVVVIVVWIVAGVRLIQLVGPQRKLGFGHKFTADIHTKHNEKNTVASGSSTPA